MRPISTIQNSPNRNKTYNTTNNQYNQPGRFTYQQPKNYANTNANNGTSFNNLIVPIGKTLNTSNHNSSKDNNTLNQNNNRLRSTLGEQQRPQNPVRLGGNSTIVESQHVSNQPMAPFKSYGGQIYSHHHQERLTSIPEYKIQQRF